MAEYRPCYMCGTALHNLVPDNFCSTFCLELYDYTTLKGLCFRCHSVIEPQGAVNGAFSRRYCSHTCYEDGERKAHHQYLRSRVDKMTDALLVMATKDEDVAFEDI